MNKQIAQIQLNINRYLTGSRTQ